MSWAIDTTRTILREGIERFAKQMNLPQKDVQIIITTYDEKDRVPVYRVAVNGTPAPINGFHPDKTPNDHVSFLQILGLDIDFLNYESIAAPFMGDALERLSKEIGTPVVYTSIMVLIDEQRNEMYYQLYKYEPANPPTKSENYIGEDGKEQTREVVVKGKQVFVREMELEKDIFGLVEEESK